MSLSWFARLFNNLGLQLLTAQLVLAAGAFGVNILSARGLGPESRGELSLYLQIAYAANLLCLLGRHRAFIRLSPSSSDDFTTPVALNSIRRLSRTPIALTFLISLGVGMVFGSGPAIVSLILAFFLKSIGGILGNTHRAAAIASRNARAFLISTLLTQSMLLAASVALVISGTSSVTIWLAVYGFTAVLPYSLTDFWAARTSPERLSDKQLADVSRTGLPFLPSGVLESFLVRVDRFLIPALSTYTQLGLYSVITTMTELSAWPAKQYVDTRVPRWTKQMEDGSFNASAQLAPVLIISAGTALATGFGTYHLVVPIFGPEYRGAVRLVAPLTLAAFFHAASFAGNNFLLAADKPRHATIANAFALIAAIPAYIAWIPKFGALGAAWGLVLAYGLMALLSLTLYWRSRGARSQRPQSSH